MAWPLVEDSFFSASLTQQGGQTFFYNVSRRTLLMWAVNARWSDFLLLSSLQPEIKGLLAFEGWKLYFITRVSKNKKYSRIRREYSCSVSEIIMVRLKYGMVQFNNLCDFCLKLEILWPSLHNFLFWVWRYWPMAAATHQLD